MDKSLGVLLRHYRHAAGLTQEALAEKAGLSYQAIGALERGARRFPRRDTVYRLVDALGLVDAQRAQLAAAAVRRPGGQRTRLSQGFGVPRQLPPDLVRFAGRDTHARAMIELLGRSHHAVVLTVVGMVGSGRRRWRCTSGIGSPPGFPMASSTSTWVVTPRRYPPATRWSS